MKREGLVTVDLFAGAGGLTQGFRAAGFTCGFANDHEAPALATFARNHRDARTSSADVRTLDAGTVRRGLGLEPGQLDALLGGPPCQGFSTYGRRDPEDHRNQLYVHFVRFLDEFRPKCFVMENVTGIFSLGGGAVIDDITARLRRSGYSATVATLDAAEYGVPQYRKRVFILGGWGGGRLRAPEPAHRAGPERPAEARRTLWDPDATLPPPVTVREAIGDLPAAASAPRATQTPAAYGPAASLTAYQARMRAGAGQLTHHSAKRMLGLRRLRLALMRPGDYGTRIRERIEQGGLSQALVDELLAGGQGLRDAGECRTEDREKEQQLRRALQQGSVDIDEVLARLDAGGFANKYRRLKWDQPSHTLVAHMARDCSDFVHPEVDRFLSVREAARLQSFPDAYAFPGSQFQQFRAIGNAVPPLLAGAVAHSVSEFLVGPRPA